MGRKTERERELERQCAAFAIDLAQARNERDQALAAATGSATAILVTPAAAAAIVEIRDLYAKDGTDEDFLRSAIYEIREARSGRVSRAAVAMQSDALDSALRRVAALEESVEIAKAAMHDAQRDLRERAQAGRLQAGRLVEEKDEARRLAREWEAKARDAGERIEERRVEVERLEEYVSQISDEVERLRGVVEAAATGRFDEPVELTAEHVLGASREEEVWLGFVAQMTGGAFQRAHGWTSILTVADSLLAEWRKRYPAEPEPEIEYEAQRGTGILKLPADVAARIEAGSLVVLVDGAAGWSSPPLQVLAVHARRNVDGDCGEAVLTFAGARSNGEGYPA